MVHGKSDNGFGTAMFVSVLIIAFFLCSACGGNGGSSTASTNGGDNDGDTDGQMLTRVHTDGRYFYDTSDKQLILRGFVTLLNLVGPMELDYALEDYQRMKSWGANYQSVRLTAPNLGAWPDYNLSERYLRRLDSLLALAKDAGVYTTMKLTMYGLGDDFDWTDLWRNQNGEQQAILEAWQEIWRRYANDPAIIGYDLLNEPQKGDLAVDDRTFNRDYLNPFYRKLVDALQGIDPNALALFQPELGSAYIDPINRTGVVYAPHFYPNLLRYETDNYPDTMEQFANEAELNQAPLLIGEYGLPWDTADEGDAAEQADFQETEIAAVDLFDEYLVGFSRPWYADDRAGVELGLFDIFNGETLTWSLIRGTGGLDGPEREFILNALVRPYPQKTAGLLQTMNFNFDNRLYILTYIPDADLGRTFVFVPFQRHYPNGFRLEHSAGITLQFDGSDFAVSANPGEIDPARFSWDSEREIIRIQEWQTGGQLTIRISRSPGP